MTLEIFESNEALSLRAAQRIIDTVSEKPTAVLCGATGDSPFLTYQHLVRIALENHVDFSQVTFVALDEWVGIPPSNPGSCDHYLKKNLFYPLHIPENHFHLFDGLSKDLTDECTKMDRIIQQLGGIDLMVVGVGMNGHIGFNEPGVSTSLRSHFIELEEQTKTVGQKYFKGTTLLTKGITLGLQHFIDARTAIIVANGKKKADIIKHTVEDPISNKIPATIIKNHSNGWIYADREAASLIKS